jgi:hypothetical protein
MGLIYILIVILQRCRAYGAGFADGRPAICPITSVFIRVHPWLKIKLV